MPPPVLRGRVSEDATLSDFLGSDSESDVESDADTESGPSEPPIESDSDAKTDAESDAETNVESEAETGAEDETGESPGAEPARSTYAWGDGRICDECSAAVDRVWRDGETLVCGGCKEW